MWMNRGPFAVVGEFHAYYENNRCVDELGNPHWVARISRVLFEVIYKYAVAVPFLGW